MSPDRYSRQTRFLPFGEEGQRCLETASAVIVGCGALGTAQAALLARAGVGRLRLIDRDYVEESNLQRQVLYTEADAAAARLRLSMLVWTDAVFETLTITRQAGVTLPVKLSS